MHTFLALVLATSLAADGGVSQLYVSCPDAPMAVQLDGGSWLMTEARWARTNCRLAACETYVEGAMEADAAPGPAAWIGIAVSIAGTIVTTGFAVWQMSQRPAPAP